MFTLRGGSNEINLYYQLRACMYKKNTQHNTTTLYFNKINKRQRGASD